MNPKDFVRETLKKSFMGKEVSLLGVNEVHPKKENGSLMAQIDLKLAAKEFEKDHPDLKSDEIQSYVVHLRKPSKKRKVQETVFTNAGDLDFPFLIKNAEILLASNEIELAKNIYNVILDSGDFTAEALDGLGRVCVHDKKWDEAQAMFEESIAYEPKTKTYEHLSSLLISRKKDDEAIEVMERALRAKDIDTDSSFEFHRACGNACLRKELRDGAESHYKDAIKLKPQADEILSNLASLYLESGRIVDAQASFEKASRINSANDKARLGLGCCYLASGQKKRAHDAFLSSLEAKIENPTAAYYLIKCAYELNIYEKAESIIQKYVYQAPVNANLLYSLAGMQFHMSKKDEARRTASKILEIRPDHQGAQNLLERL